MKLLIFVVFSFCLHGILCRKHQEEIVHDDRGFIPISTFGFYRNGILKVQVDKFKITPPQGISLDRHKFGFSLEKTSNPYIDQHNENCLLNNFETTDSNVQHVFFIFDLKKKKIRLNCSADMRNLHVFVDQKQMIDIYDGGGKFEKVADTFLFPKSSIKRDELGSRSRRDNSDIIHEGLDNMTRSVEARKFECENVVLNMTLLPDDYYSFKFLVFVANEKEEGVYNLNFHDCFNYENSAKALVDISLKVEELNPDDNYLSAGEMPLPALYFMMALLFFLSAFFWFFILKKSKDPVFKIHYLMGLVVVIKALSLFLHGINYHYIQIKGIHMEAWAVMFYIMHLLKGALLFTVLALIGSGWAFIKHILSSKEKKIFIIVIPLQIIANVAMIIIEETEESDAERRVWSQLLYLIDFLCCGAILLPVVWSIRHLQEASHTDGKAASSLQKLKLFRHFYIMIVCYIYFTRIIVYLLRITVPFQYEWLDDMFREMATYVFFVMTGYKFRPAHNNPYFRVDSDDEEMDEVLTTTGLTEGLVRVNQKPMEAKAKKLQMEIYDDDEEVNLLDTKESSHVFD